MHLRILIAYIILFASAVYVSCDAFDKYCSLPCGSDMHTVCLRRNQSCGPDPQCGKEFKPVRFSDSERKFILDIHNHFRNYIAGGSEKRGTGQPPAANMKALVYDKELEYTAQCWVNTCREKLQHDKCRRTSTYPLVGQNLAATSTTARTIDIIKAVKKMIINWYEEVTMFNSKDIKDIKQDGRVGHYLQLVWANTREIGCAASEWTTNDGVRKWRHLLFACNYAPAGNVLKTPVYEVGLSASKCPNGKKHTQYRSLCDL